MALFNFRWLKRDGGLINTPQGWLVDWLGGKPSLSGVSVNEESSISFTAVWAAVKLLSEAVAGLPIQTYRRTETTKELDKKNPIYNLLHTEPSPYMTSFTFHQAMMTNVLLYGNAYAIIHRDNREIPQWLEIIPPTEVEVSVARYKWFKIQGRANKVPDRNMIHIPGLTYDGIIGKSPIQVCKESIGLGLAAERFGASFFGSGANMSGVLEAPFALTPDQITNIKKSWNKQNAGIDNSNQTAVLEGGMKYTRIGIPPDQAQFILTRKFQVTEIARIFNVPPHLIGDLERSTNNNIEQQAIEFVQFSLMPWIKRFEQEYNRKLFAEDDKESSYVQFSVTGLLRGDAAARASYYSTMFNIGAISDNEIRGLEDMNPVEGGDKHLVPLNMQVLEDIEKNKDNEQQGDTIPSDGV